MTKLAGSYESVVRGVSEQVPQDRRSGQHTAQVNMVSDPVRGLARRHGSVLQAETILAAISQAEFPDLVKDTAFHKTFPFTCLGTEYDLLYRSVGDTYAMGRDGFAWCFDKAAKQFIPVVHNVGDATLNALVSGGVSAVVNVGRFLYLAGHSITPTATETDLWAAADNQRRMAVWVRGGAYSRTFTATLIRPDGTKVIATYKTVSASYPTLLDTSDLVTSDTDYQKKVNDRVNAYNGQVTKWIGTAAEDITPENIAQRLVESFVSQGVTGVYRVGGVITIDNATFSEISADDRGDGSLIRAVGNEVSAIDKVSVTHWVGKLVKVVPSTDTKEALYLQAVAKDKVSTGWAEVVWREAAGYKMIPSGVFAHGTVHAGTLYLAGSPEALSALTGLSCPSYSTNTVGDNLSCPLPEMIGRTITYLGLFQDRLVIGAGATILLSQRGDYLNWFRKSVTTLVDDDPCEGFALGAEDDIIRHGTLYDRNLVLYGEKFEFILSGRQAITPSNFSIVVVTAYEDAADAEPKVSGNFVFYSRYSGEDDNKLTSLHQVQAGVIADSPESYNTSQALDTYLKGLPVEILALTAPNIVLLRTSTERNRVYTYSYLDSANGSERLFDSWSHWEWDEAIGSVVGLSKYAGGILIYMLRSDKDKDGVDRVWLACERFVRDTNLSNYPYADSLRSLSAFIAPAATAYLNPASTFLARSCVAISGRREKRFLGVYLPQLSEFTAAYASETSYSYVGVEFPAYVTPTNPFPTDRQGKPILSGRMTLGRVIIGVADTGGFDVTKKDYSGVRTVVSFAGQVLGGAGSIIGTQPIVSSNIPATIAGEIRECSYSITAKRWLPLTVTSIEWVGQLFNNTKRA